MLVKNYIKNPSTNPFNFFRFSFGNIFVIFSRASMKFSIPLGIFQAVLHIIFCLFFFDSCYINALHIRKKCLKKKTSSAIPKEMYGFRKELFELYPNKLPKEFTKKLLNLTSKFHGKNYSHVVLIVSKFQILYYT